MSLDVKVRGVPKPGLPPQYPKYLKPIPVNTRDVLIELRKYLDSHEPKVARWLYSTWEAEAEALKYQEIRNALRDGQIPQELIDTWQQDYSKFVAEVIEPEWKAAMEEAASRIAGAVNVAFPKPGEAFFWTPTGKHVTDWISTRGAELAVNLSNTQHRALRALLVQYTTVEPLPVDELARRLRPVIGLTEGEARAVEAFRQSLVAEGGLTAKQIEHQVQNYSARLHRLRALRIARNEVVIAYKEGQRDAMTEARDTGWFDGLLVKTWQTADDERVCATCGPMDGVTCVFDDPYPGTGTMTPHAHIKCRCSETYDVLETVKL